MFNWYFSIFCISNIIFVAEAPSTEIEVHLTGPILLCLIGAGAVLAICFKMPGNNPIEKGEYKLAENEENDKNDQEIDEDPLCSNKSISEAWTKLTPEFWRTPDLKAKKDSFHQLANLNLLSNKIWLDFLINILLLK